MTDLHPSPRVLIVEDDYDIRETLTDVLREEGYDVAGAANGQEALDYLATHDAPRVILLDLMMPVMNGWQFRAEQLQNPKLASIPVVVVSADGGVREKAEMVKASDFLKKPVMLEELLERIRRYC